MGAKGKISVRAWNYPSYELVGTPFYHEFNFYERPTLEPRVIPMADGTDLSPGDCITEFRGHNTSAMSQGFRLLKGCLRYEGCFTDEKGTAVCFTYHGPSIVSQETLFEPQYQYFGFKLLNEVGETQFMWVTPAVVPRIAETKIVSRVTGPLPQVA